ncbi:cytochrome c1 [Altericroceibacterium spongiae]|uniref:Cytochrome c1 n=1 Tax=Altericroceibacterium spongiae TaxID=2320269 RepID=A0A420EII3_9SPHN|nr:cytochrome c1 [Altericroceibacterium spongiae]RKF20531.1 cytochrome c1 [Altericroceibacterium spongiae]
MIRIIGIAAGAFFTLSVLWAFVTGAYTAITEPAPETAEHAFHKHPRELHLQSDGPFGTWNLQQLQRGYQVYKEVCSACHSLKFVAMRDLEQLGYSEAEVKAEAASWTVPGVDPDTGEATTRSGEPTDYFPSPYPNEVAAAAANNNAVPPDLSLMTKARHDGSAYVYSLLTGFQEQPEKLLEEFPQAKTPAGLHYNPYFANLNLAMAPPLTMDGQVTYADGTEATIDQMAQDVAAFLTWTAEPSLPKRKQTGWPVLGFLLFATILAYLAKQQIWARVKPDKNRQDD